MMSTYSKNALIKELTIRTGVKRKDVVALLDGVFEIACREATVDGFTFPGLCKLDMAVRKARRMRNPRTGKAILIAEHQAPRIRILKKAKSVISEKQEKTIVELDETTPSEKSGLSGVYQEEKPLQAVPVEWPVEEVPAAEPVEETEKEAEKVDEGIVYDDFSVAVSFTCKDCGGEIEAPVAAAGYTSECPVCGKSVLIPHESEPGTIHAPRMASITAEVENAVEQAFSGSEQPAQKNQTIRIDLSTLDLNAPDAPKPKARIVSFFCKSCRQELEAPAEMMGMQSECPDCGVKFEVPFFSDPGTLHGSDLEKPAPEKANNGANRTIRIEMPDF